MNNTALFAGTAMLVLTATGAVAGSLSHPIGSTIDIYPVQSKSSTLYSQNSNFDNSIVSQNFTSGAMGTYNAAAADDFVVPTGKTWTVTEVDVTGQYFFGSGPASSEVITFYQNSDRRPGNVIDHPQTVICNDSAGSFACKIRRVKLSGGLSKGKTYWLSVVANCNYGTCGEWGWVQTSTHHNPGQWENPGGGFGTTCATWNDTSKCWTLSGVVDDYAFDLKGTSN